MREETGQTMDCSPPSKAAQSRQEFIEAWQQVLGAGGDPPSIERMLAAFDDPPSVEFRQDIESLEALFRERWNRGEGSMPPAAAGATMNFTPGRTVGRAVAGKADSTLSDPVSAIAQGQENSSGEVLERTGETTAAELANALDNGVGVDANTNTLTFKPTPPSAATDATGMYQPGEPSAPGGTNAETRAFFADDTPDARRAARKAPVPLPDKVAGYEILGVLGRGGMGVVYKARQPGLKRLVALKMILAGGHASSEDLARFRSEAEAVALLQHPNIVQVYEIGEEDGRPYFSLEYVEGSSLVQKLEGKPQLPRQAAEMIHVLAQAMAAAHARGIVHRDLKPANILVSREGVLKITDFGLAKRLEDDDGGQTRSGSILGTPDYMSPEQASGRIREVGPASDVYALGAMLYEMLAGRVPLRGASVLDTLRQVVSKEPVAPTQLDPKVPRDLETISLKCLHKDAAKRYARVDDLAEDLRRYLAGEPILARPVSRVERAWRWCRRNPRVATLSGVVALMVLAWGASASAVAMKFKQKNEQIATALDVAKANEEKATENERLARLQETEAKHQATIAKERAVQADKNATLAVASADAAKDQHRKAADLLVDLGKHLEQRLQGRRSLAEKPELRGLQAELLGMVQASMTELAKQLEASNVTSFAMTHTCFNLGELLFRFGHGEEAMRQFRYGYKLVKQVAESQPESDLARANLAVMLMQMGKMELELNDDAATARRHFVEAHDLYQAIADKPQNNGNYTEVDHHRMLSFYDLSTGIADLHLGRPAVALTNFNAALAHREAWVQAQPNNISARSYLAEAQYYLGVTGWHLNDLEATQDHFRKALSVCHDLAAKFPADFSFQLDLAQTYGDYSDAKLRLGKAEEARAVVAKSLEFLQAVLAHDPDFVSRQALLAQTYERQAIIAERLNEPDEARRLFNEARVIRGDLEVVDANNQAWKMAAAVVQAHCGEHEAAAQKAHEVVDRSPDNIGLLLQAARCWATCASAASDADAKAAYRRRAIETLRNATAGEFRDVVWLATDPELSLLADEGEYAALLAEIKARDTSRAQQ